MQPPDVALAHFLIHLCGSYIAFLAVAASSSAARPGRVVGCLALAKELYDLSLGATIGSALIDLATCWVGGMLAGETVLEHRRKVRLHDRRGR